MNLAWHIAKKDIRSLWPLIALFGLFLAGEWVVGLDLLFDSDASNSYWVSELRQYALLFVYLAFGVSILIGERIVHSDPLISTGAFWKTRPISGGRLLRGKLLSLVLIFGAFPILIRAPWWVFNRFGVGDLLVAAADSAAWYGVVAVITLVVAVLTPNLRWFLGGLVILAGVVFLTIYNIAALGGWGDSLLEDIRSTRVWLSLAVVAVAFALIVRTQFLRQDHRTSLKVVAIAIALVSAVVNYWPWNLTKAESAFATSDPTPATAGVTLKYEGATMRSDHDSAIRLKLDGVPTGYFAAIDAAHEWRFPNAGGSMAQSGWGYYVVQRKSLDGVVGAKIDLGPDFVEVNRGRWLFSPWEISAQNRFQLVVRPPAARIVDSVPEYTLRAKLELRRALIGGEVPAKKGEVISNGNRLTRIASAAVENGGVTLELVESFPAPIWNDFDRAGIPRSERFGYWLAVRLMRFLPNLGSSTDFVAIDRRAGTAKPMTGRIGSSNTTNAGTVFSRDARPTVRIAGVAIARGQMATLGSSAGVATGPLTVARIDYESIPFTRRIDVPRFELGNTYFVGMRSQERAFSGSVTVRGAVGKPERKVQVGSPWQSNAIAVLREAGSLADDADLDRPVLIHRTKDGRTTDIPFDLRGYLDGNIAPEAVPILEPGDVIEVPRRGG